MGASRFKIITFVISERIHYKLTMNGNTIRISEDVNKIKYEHYWFTRRIIHDTLIINNYLTKKELDIVDSFDTLLNKLIMTDPIDHHLIQQINKNILHFDKKDAKKNNLLPIFKKCFKLY